MSSTGDAWAFLCGDERFNDLATCDRRIFDAYLRIELESQGRGSNDRLKDKVWQDFLEDRFGLQKGSRKFALCINQQTRAQRKQNIDPPALDAHSKNAQGNVAETHHKQKVDDEGKELKDGGQTLEFAPSGKRRCCKETPAWATQFTADRDRNLFGFGQGRKRKRWEAEMESLEETISSKRRIGGFAPQWAQDELSRAKQSMARRWERVRDERGMLKCDTGLQLPGVTGPKRYLPTVNAKRVPRRVKKHPKCLKYVKWHDSQTKVAIFNYFHSRFEHHYYSGTVNSTANFQNIALFPNQDPRELAAFKRAQRGDLKPPPWWYTAVNAFEAAYPDRSIRRFFEPHIMRMERATLYKPPAEGWRKSPGYHPPIANKSYRFFLGGPVAKRPVAAKGV
ncbi:MAG: hypothetical protein M1836_006114 [Candelina mexicana]|nr:MAG: hypothetical protein M1836_006114 [Candelina mexicana]